MGCVTQPVPGTFAAGFLLTHPVWDVTWIAYIGRSNDEFLLTHPVWDVTDWLLIYEVDGDISTHTSRVGCDDKTSTVLKQTKKFLLTHPVWDVTLRSWKDSANSLNFYSHIPCGM